MPHGLCKVWKPCNDKKKMLRSCHRNWIMEKSNGWNFRGVQCHSEPMLSYCAGSWIQIMVLPRTGEKGNRNLFSLTCMAFMRIRWGKAHTWERFGKCQHQFCLSFTNSTALSSTLLSCPWVIGFNWPKEGWRVFPSAAFGSHPSGTCCFVIRPSFSWGSVVL